MDDYRVEAYKVLLEEIAPKIDENNEDDKPKSPLSLEDWRKICAERMNPDGTIRTPG